MKKKLSLLLVVIMVMMMGMSTYAAQTFRGVGGLLIIFSSS